MALNQKYKERRVNSLPTSNLKAGDRYYLNVGNNKYQTYIVSDNLQLIKEAGAEFIEKDTMAEMRAISSREIWALKNGYYKGVKLNGYYVKGDTPTSIEYKLSATSATDDGGSVIAVGGIKLVHVFIGKIDVRYFGAKDDVGFDSTNSLKSVFNYSKNSIIPMSVYVPSGTYLVTDTLYPSPNTTIVGDGDNSLLQFKHGRFSETGEVKWMFRFTDQKNVKFENLKFHGGATTLNEVPYDVDGAEFIIYFQPISDGAVNNITINKCTFEASWSGCIQSYGRSAHPYPHPLTNNIRITDCVFTNCGEHGIGMNEWTNSLVTGCTFLNIGLLVNDPSNLNGGGGMAVDASAGCSNIIIAKNIVDGASAGFKCETHVKPDNSIQSSKNIIIKDNHIKNLQKGEFYKIFYGIRINGEGCLVSGNTIDNPQGHGIVVSYYAKDCLLSDNRIYNPLRAGIENGSAFGGIQIKGNHIFDSVDQGITTESSNTIIDGNIILRSKKTGIRLLNGSNINISNNIVQDSIGDGINAIPTGSNVSKNITLFNNTCFDSRVGSERTQTVGIQANSPSVQEVKSLSNTCYNNINQDVSLPNSLRRNMEIGSYAYETQTTNGINSVDGNWGVGDRLINVNAVVQHSDPVLKYTLGWYNISNNGRTFIPYGFLGEYVGKLEPNGNISAREGSRYTQIDDINNIASLWIKKNGGDGNTGWIRLDGNATLTVKGLVNQGVHVPDGSSVDTLLASLRTAGIIASS